MFTTRPNAISKVENNTFVRLVSEEAGACPTPGELDGFKRFRVHSFSWTRNKGARTGSRQRHHSTAVRITVIIYTTMTKLNEDREKGDTSRWPTVEQDKRSKLSQSNGPTPLTSCILFRQRASYYCACHPHRWGHRGTSTSVPSVSKTPVHHRRQPSKPSIDATNQSISDNPSAPSSLWQLALRVIVVRLRVLTDYFCMFPRSSMTS